MVRLRAGVRLRLSPNLHGGREPRHQERAETRDGLAQGDFAQPAVLAKLVEEQGVQIHYWKPEILAAFKSAWDEVATEEMAVNPEFKRVYENYMAFREEFAIWRDNGYLK